MATANALDRAALYLDAGRAVEALSLLNAHLATQPDDVRALCLVTRAHVDAGNPLQGISSGKRAAALGPDNEWAWRLLALAFSNAAQHQDARDASARARELAPNNWRTHLQAATVDIKAGEVTLETQIAAQRAVELAPSEPLAHFILGNVALAKKDLQSAEDAYRRALALNPQMESARINLSLVTLRQGALGTAAAGFIDILAENPTSSLARRNALAAISATLARGRFALGAGVVAANLIWSTAFSEGGQASGSTPATHVGLIGMAVAVGLSWVVLAARFVAGARMRVRHLLRAAWRFDRAQCWIAILTLVVYSTLVMAAVQTREAGFWLACCLVLYAGVAVASFVRRARRR